MLKITAAKNMNILLICFIYIYISIHTHTHIYIICLHIHNVFHSNMYVCAKITIPGIITTNKRLNAIEHLILFIRLLYIFHQGYAISVLCFRILKLFCFVWLCYQLDIQIGLFNLFSVLRDWFFLFDLILY